MTSRHLLLFLILSAASIMLGPSLVLHIHTKQAKHPPATTPTATTAIALPTEIRDILVAVVDEHIFSTFYSRDMVTSLSGYVKNCPKMSNCFYSFDPTNISRADGIVFNGPNVVADVRYIGLSAVHDNFVQKRLLPNQAVAFLSGEMDSAEWSLPGFKELYNIKMTTHYNSDIPIPYGCGAFMEMLKGRAAYSQHLLNSRAATTTAATATATAAATATTAELPIPAMIDASDGQEVYISAFVSNCNSAPRNEYLTELMKHMKVHSYGACQNNIQPPVGRQAGNWEAGKNELIGKYKFHFAFENDAASYYITEKIWNCYSANTVPVYWGAPEIGEVVPKNSYIDVHDFLSVADLAAHLKRVGSDEQLYRKLYFDQWDVSHMHNAKMVDACKYSWSCRLCAELATRHNVSLIAR